MKLLHFLHPTSSSSSSSSEGNNKRKQRINSLFPESSSTNSSTSSPPPSNRSNVDWKHAFKFDRNTELEQAFMVLDADGDGYISLEELKAWMRSLFSNTSNKAKEPSEEELAFMVVELDKDADGFLNFEDLCQFLFPSSSSLPLSSSCLDEDEAAWFHAVDLNNDGVISCEELHEVMVQSLGMKSCTIHECRLIISSHDSDGDGFLNTQEFRKLLLA